MKILDYELVELEVALNSNSATFKFLQQDTLTSKSDADIGIRGIEIFTFDSIPVAPSGNPVSTFAQVQNAVLALTSKGRVAINKIPLVKLLHLRNTNAAGYFAQEFADEFDDLEIDWTRSSVSIPAVYGGNVKFSFLFGFSYGRYNAGTLETIKAARTR